MMKEYIDLKRRIIYRGDAYQAINDELIKVSAYAIGSEYMRGVEDGMKRTLGVLANRVKDIPAADVAPVRHGRWVHGRETGREYLGDCLFGIFYDRWTCSECGYVVDDHEYSGINYKFCPNCGAKMTEV